MYILTFIHEFPPIGGGGGRAAYDICRELVKRGHQITVVTAHLHGLIESEFEDGMRLIRLHSFRDQPYRAYFLTMLAFVIAGVWTGGRLIRSQRPDILHAHFAVPAGAVAWLLSRFTGIPYVLTAHLGDVPGGVPEKTDQWFRWILPLTPPIWRDAKRVVAVSEFTRGLARKHYPVDIDILPNGVDLNEIAIRKVELNNPVQLVFAGRFMDQKNPNLIPKILSRLKDLDWRCAMIGDGPLRAKVIQQIREYQLEDRFDLPGWLTPGEVLNRFSQSDILFMPSVVEGLPVTGVQALAKGLAFVVSKIAGFMDLVQPGVNGFLVDKDDETGFASRLRDLITDPMMLLRFRQASLVKALNFDIESVGERYEKLLIQAANG